MQYFTGPEILWLLFYLAVSIIVKTKVPQTKSVEHFIQTCWFWVPLFALLSFAFWWFPPIEKDWLLLRIWVSGLVGGYFTLAKLISASQTQNSGSGMGYFAGMIFMLTAGSIIIALKIYLS